jgi:hypothetical protein
MMTYPVARSCAEVRAGLAHDRSPSREKQARSSAARSCAPRSIVPAVALSVRGSAGVICDVTEVESQISRRARAIGGAQARAHVRAGLAHDRSPSREKQARSSAARSCAPRPGGMATGC